MDVNSLNLEPGGCLSVIKRKQFVAGESATVAALDFCAGQHLSYEAALPGVWTRTRGTFSSYYNPGHMAA
jgi:hypothetical protein